MSGGKLLRAYKGIVRSWQYPSITVSYQKRGYREENGTKQPEDGDVISAQTSRTNWRSDASRRARIGPRYRFNFGQGNEEAEKHHNEKGRPMNLFKSANWKTNDKTRFTSRVLTAEEKSADTKLASSFNDDEDVFGDNESPRKGRPPRRSFRRSHSSGEAAMENERNNGTPRTKSLGHQAGDGLDDEFGSLENSEKHLYRKEGLPRNWENVFGTLSSNERDQDEFEEDEDEDELDRPHIRLSAENRRHRPVWYARKMVKLEKQGKVVEALQLFETMIQRDRVMPTFFEFNTIIGILGRVGYTKKAFKLFNQMKKMGIRPMPHTYTALFNACSNSPWPSDGLHRARRLEELMEEKQYQPNFFTIVVMIKTFGVCGDLEHALKLMDDAMFKYKYPVKSDHLNALLCGCITDKEAGLRHALLVWRKLKPKVKPIGSTYQLLLKCMAECGIGDENLADDLLPSAADLELLEAEQKPFGEGYMKLEGCSPVVPVSVGSFSSDEKEREGETVKDVDVNSLESHQTLNYDEFSTTKTHTKNLLQKTNCDLVAGSILSEERHVSDPECDKSSEISISGYEAVLSSESTESALTTHSVDSIESLISRRGRIALVGGLKHFLAEMQADDVQPSVHTFCALLDVVSAGDQAQLLKMMKDLNVTPDTVFFNALIKSHCKRKDYEGAWEVFLKLKEAGLKPDMTTFYTLSGASVAQRRVKQFFKEMDAANFTPNIQIMGRLFRTSWMKFQLKVDLITWMKSLDLKPDEKMIVDIERSIKEAKHQLVRKEKGLLDKDSFLASESFEHGFLSFMKHYEDWLSRVDLEKPRHPWQQFQKVG